MNQNLDEPITGMTYRELRAIIAEEVQARLSESIETELEGYVLASDPAQAAEALRWLRENRWSAPAGSPSSIEILRQDRDRDA